MAMRSLLIIGVIGCLCYFIFLGYEMVYPFFFSPIPAQTLSPQDYREIRWDARLLGIGLPNSIVLKPTTHSPEDRQSLHSYVVFSQSMPRIKELKPIASTAIRASFLRILRDPFGNPEVEKFYFAIWSSGGRTAEVFMAKTARGYVWTLNVLKHPDVGANPSDRYP